MWYERLGLAPTLTASSSWPEAMQEITSTWSVTKPGSSWRELIGELVSEMTHGRLRGWEAELRSALETKLSEASGQLTGASGAMRFDVELTLEPSRERESFRRHHLRPW